jgi:hypothetical protein
MKPAGSINEPELEEGGEERRGGGDGLGMEVCLAGGVVAGAGVGGLRGGALPPAVAALLGLGAPEAAKEAAHGRSVVGGGDGAVSGGEM